MSSKQRAEAAKEKGNRAFGEGNFDEAIRQYSEAIKIDARNHVYFSNRSAAYAGKNMWAQALEDSEQCIRLNRTWGKGYYRKAVALLGQNKLTEAQRALTEGLSVDGANADLRTKLQEVQTLIERAHKFIGPDGQPLTGAALARAEGNDLFKNGKYEEAAACYTRALAGTTDARERSILLSNRAACWSQYQNWNRMLEDCNLALQEDPTNVKALLRRGLAYEGLEKYKLAIADMKAVLELDPQAMVASSAIARLSRFIR